MMMVRVRVRVRVEQAAFELCDGGEAEVATTRRQSLEKQAEDGEAAAAVQQRQL